MAEKCLIIYASRTGNTEKIALVFKKVFEKNGWQCDLVKVNKDVKVEELSYDYKDYDFVCAGSPVHNGLAVEEIITALRKVESKYEIPHEKIVPGSSSTNIRNPNYWRYDDRWPENKLPYLDEVRQPVIPVKAVIRLHIISLIFGWKIEMVIKDKYFMDKYLLLYIMKYGEKKWGNV